MVAALAAPLAGVLGVSTTTASIGLSVAAYAATTAASIFLQMSMMEEPKQDIGTKLSAVLGGAVNQSIHVGVKESAGSFLYVGTWGRAGRVPNAFLTRVYCLGDRPVAGFKGYVWGGGKKCNYDPGETQTIDGVNIGHPINAFKVGGENRLWVKFHDGTQTSADNYLVAKFGSDPDRPWTEDHIGRGRPYMIVTQKYDKKEPAGEVDIIAAIDRSRLYDWRNDSTNGGSGTERYGNYGTYSIDPGNPVRVIYNIMRGIYHGSEWLYGGQAWPATRFDNDSWTAAANKCDEDVTVTGGGTQKRFRMGAELDVSEEPLTVIERCLKACNGRLVESGGVYKIYVGGIGASVYSFTDDDIIVTEELTGRLFPAREKIANTINGTYVEPDNAGEVKAFKARFKQAYIDADGDVRKTVMDFEYVRDNRQAQRLAMLALNDNRRFRTFVVAFWTQARKLEPCDVVSWTSARFGFSAKKFIVGDVVLREDGVVIVNLREADANDANWTTSDEDEYELGVFEDIDPPPQILIATVTAVAITDDDDTTERRAAIRIQATLDDDFVDCRALRVQVRKKNGDQKIIYRNRSESFFEPDNDDYGDITFSNNAFMPGRQVQVRHKIEPESDRTTDWSAWVDLTLTDIPDAGVSDDPPPDLASAPTIALVTRIQKSGEVVQKLLVDVDLTGRDAKENYVIRVSNTTDSEATRYETKEFPFPVPVLANRSYQIRVRPVSRFGVPGNLSGLATGVTMPIAKWSGNVPAVSGLSITPGHRKNVLEWDQVVRATYPDYDHSEIQEDSSNTFPSPTTKETKGNNWTDGKVANGETRYYRMRHVDTSDNPSAWSSTVSATTTRLDDDDLSGTGPNNPTSLSLSTAAADVDDDGTQDPVLLLAWVPAVTGPEPKSYAIEIHRSTSSGSGFTLWRKFTADGDDTQLPIPKPNSRFFYRAYIKARGGAKNWPNGGFAGPTGSVKPTKRAFSLAVGSTTVSWASYRRKNVIRANNAPVDDSEFAYLEWYRKTGASTFVLIEKSRRNKIEDINPPANVTGYRIKYYDITSNPSPLSYDSPSTQSGGNEGVDDITTNDIGPLAVTTAKIANFAINGNKLGHGITQVQKNQLGAGVSTLSTISMNVQHGDADQMMVWASCINASGAARIGITVSLHNGAGTQFAGKVVSVGDGGQISIEGTLSGLTGTATTVELRVTGGFNKKDRDIYALPVW